MPIRAANLYHYAGSENDGQKLDDIDVFLSGLTVRCMIGSGLKVSQIALRLGTYILSFKHGSPPQHAIQYINADHHGECARYLYTTL